MPTRYYFTDSSGISLTEEHVDDVAAISTILSHLPDHQQSKVGGREQIRVSKYGDDNLEIVLVDVFFNYNGTQWEQVGRKEYDTGL